MPSEVRIQLMDYQYVAGTNVADINNNTSKDASWTITSATSATFAASASPSTQYLNNFILPITGVEYTISATISGYSGSGDIGFSTSGGPPSSARRSSNGSISATFIAIGGAASNGIDLFARNTVTAATMSSIVVKPVTQVDIPKSIIGELDISSHNDFPLALTFNIADYKSVEARKGSFSKTFIIPATKHNNSLLKNIYVPNSTFSGNPISEQKRCRILVDNFYSLEGLLKITASTTDKTPSSYSCVFFGDNTAWTTLLEDAKLQDVPLGGTTTGLEIKKDSIMDSWSQVDATTTTSPLIYPLVSYGDYNQFNGEPQSVQLLMDDATATAIPGGGNSGGAYVGTVAGNIQVNVNPPALDWRVCIWVYDLFKAIFKTIGYTISSSFIESDLFKRLLYAPPNMKYNNSGDRWHSYTFKSHCAGTDPTDNFVSNQTITTSSGGSSSWSNTTYITLDFNSGNISQFIIDNDDSNGWDVGTGYWTSSEYGYYDLELNNISIEIDNMKGLSSGGTSTQLTRVHAQVYLVRKTVGQTHWGAMFDPDGNPSYYQETVEIRDMNYSGATSTEKTASIDISKLEVKGVFLNKGDIIRLRVQFKHEYLGSSTPSATYPQYQVSVYAFNAEYSSFPRASYNINFQPHIATYGQTYDLRNFIPDEHTQIDFIKGIAHAFNLQFQTDERQKLITIEPFNDFYKDLGLAVDWTPKIDRSKEIKDEWVKSELKREMQFKYKSDSNDKAGKDLIPSWNGIDDIYPYFETLSDAFSIGKTEFTNPFFAGTWSMKDGDASWIFPPSTAILSTDPISNAPLGLSQVNPPYRAPKAYSFQPRLLYYNQYVHPTSPAAGASYKSMEIQEWGAPFAGAFSSANWKMRMGKNTAGQTNTFIPQATSFDNEDTAIPNLCYGNIWCKQYYPLTTSYGAQEIHKGLYATYYRGMIEMLKAHPRRRTCYVDLKVGDIIGLDFRNLIHIDETYWRLNKIIDYAPHLNQTTKVELVEWTDLGEFQVGEPSIQYNGWFPYDPNNLGL